MLIDAGQMSRIELAALKPSRAPVLPGGLAILLGLMQELNVDRMEPAEGALRLGVVYDMLHQSDGPPLMTRAPSQCRACSVATASTQNRPGESRHWRKRCGSALIQPDRTPCCRGPRRFMRSGMAIAHEDYHQHSAYIIEHPTFTVFPSRSAPHWPCWCFGHTGSIKKIDRASLLPKPLSRLVCLRPASLFCHGRVDQS